MLRPWNKALLPTILLLSSPTFADNHADKINAFKQSWTASALKLQREIDLHTPLNEATILGTHNSYNAQVYQIPFIRYIDPNQLISLYDQLEMGVRSIELDAHWTVNSHFSKDILLCHGLKNHVGCGPLDREFPAGLVELRDWLKANPNEVVLLYIERHLDGHEPRLASQLEDYLGQFIFKPAILRSSTEHPRSCISIPPSLTKADILNAGKQLLIVSKDCDGAHPRYEEQNKFPQIWNDFVFAGIGHTLTEPFSFLDSTIDETIAYPQCGKSSIFQPDPQHDNVWRIFEDRTMLSPSKQLDAVEMIGLLKCGVNWPTMDMLEVADPRLKATIWSWAPNYPKENRGQCVGYKWELGMQNAACSQTMSGFACREINTLHIKAIAIPGTWAEGETMCQNVAGKNWHFITPVNAEQMYTLKKSMASLAMQEVWLNYTYINHHWVANPKKIILIHLPFFKVCY